MSLSGIIIKPDKDEDWYVIWSNIAEDVLAAGPRSYLEPRLAVSNGDVDRGKRFHTADIKGTSSYLRTGAYDEEWLICRQRLLKRSDLRAYVEARLRDENDDGADYLHPIEED